MSLSVMQVWAYALPAMRTGGPRHREISSAQLLENTLMRIANWMWRKEWVRPCGATAGQLAWIMSEGWRREWDSNPR